MTYNIRLDFSGDGEDRWDERKVELTELLKTYSPSFLGVQEALSHQMNYLDSALVSHSYIGVGRDDGKRGGEFSAIFYDTLQFQPVKSNTFWLSDSSNTVSVGWDAAMERVCTWGLFREKHSGRKIYVFNTHYDHVGKEARSNSSRLITRHIKSLSAGDPVVLMGDFNATRFEEPIQIILKEMSDGMEVSNSRPEGPHGTWNGFELDAKMTRRIDYIFVRNLEVQTYVHLDVRRKNGRHVSDHLPVMATVSLK